MPMSEKNDPELRESLWKYIQAANPRVVKKKSDKFFIELAVAIQNYRQQIIGEHTRRDSYEALRDLFKLIEKSSNQTEKIRRKFSNLPSFAREYIMRRATWRKDEFFRNKEPTWENLAYWAENSRTEELLEKIPMLIATGQAWSFGQERESGERSAPHIEPMVMGRFGRLHRPDIDWYKPNSVSKGGRPPKEAADHLLQAFGLLWLETAGHAPERKRGKKTPFVEAAEALLSYVGIKNPGKTLKRFWDAIDFHKARVSQVP